MGDFLNFSRALFVTRRRPPAPETVFQSPPCWALFHPLQFCQSLRVSPKEKHCKANWGLKFLDWSGDLKTPAACTPRKDLRDQKVLIVCLPKRVAIVIITITQGNPGSLRQSAVCQGFLCLAGKLPKIPQRPVQDKNEHTNQNHQSKWRNHGPRNTHGCWRRW